jgi:hypothetical protein
MVLDAVLRRDAAAHVHDGAASSGKAVSTDSAGPEARLKAGSIGPWDGEARVGAGQLGRGPAEAGRVNWYIYVSDEYIGFGSIQILTGGQNLNGFSEKKRKRTEKTEAHRKMLQIYLKR